MSAVLFPDFMTEAMRSGSQNATRQRPNPLSQDFSAARLQDAKCLRKNAINIRNVLSNLRTYNDVKRRIWMI